MSGAAKEKDGSQVETARKLYAQASQGKRGVTQGKGIEAWRKRANRRKLKWMLKKA